MFEINIKTAKKVLSELQTQLRQLNRIIYETEEIVLRYKGLEKSLEELDMLKQHRKRMLECVSALRQIIELYEETEEQILEDEGTVEQRSRREAFWVAVQYSEEINSFIKQIKI